MPLPIYEWDVSGSAFPSIPLTLAGRALPVGRDIAFDETTGKFKLSPLGDLTLTQDLDAIRQAVGIALRFLLGEWFLDTTVGVPYFQTILVKDPNLSAIREIYREKIEAVEGIVEVTSLVLNWDKAARKLSVNWTASTNLGQPLSGSEAAPLTGN